MPDLDHDLDRLEAAIQAEPFTAFAYADLLGRGATRADAIRVIANTYDVEVR